MGSSPLLSKLFWGLWKSFKVCRRARAAGGHFFESDNNAQDYNALGTLVIQTTDRYLRRIRISTKVVKNCKLCWIIHSLPNLMSWLLFLLSPSALLSLSVAFRIGFGYSYFCSSATVCKLRLLYSIQPAWRAAKTTFAQLTFGKFGFYLPSHFNLVAVFHAFTMTFTIYSGDFNGFWYARGRLDDRVMVQWLSSEHTSSASTWPLALAGRPNL